MPLFKQTECFMHSVFSLRFIPVFAAIFDVFSKSGYHVRVEMRFRGKIRVRALTKTRKDAINIPYLKRQNWMEIDRTNARGLCYNDTIKRRRKRRGVDKLHSENNRLD